MRAAVILALSAMVGFSGLPGARADDTDAKIDAIMVKANSEWTVLLTCTALDVKTHDFLVGAIADTKARSKALLEQKGFAGDKIALMLARFGEPASAVKDDAPAADLMAYCHAHPEWQEQMGTMQFTIPHLALAELFGAKP